MEDNITDLGEARGQKFLDDLAAGKYPAMSAGYKPIEDSVNWYLANGYSHGDTLHAFAYSAAAQCFRDLAKDDAEEIMMQTFVIIVFDLLCYGPHYGDEEYGGKLTREQMEKSFTSLQAVTERLKNAMLRD